MIETVDLDARLLKSVMTLRSWRWMSHITDKPDEVVQLLKAEARTLIDLGRDHPARAKDIGKLIVAYHKLIVRIKSAGSGCPAARNDVAA